MVPLAAVGGGGGRFVQGAWHLVVAIYNARSGENSLYVDGHLEGTWHASTSFPSDDRERLILPATVGGEGPWDGDAANVATFDDALSDDQVAQLQATADPQIPVVRPFDH